jgi:uncharacterized protein
MADNGPRGLQFEWDADKAQANARDHGVTFEEAQTVFGDLLSRTFPDPDHSVGEERLIDIGLSTRGRVLMVVYTERHGRI